MKTIEERIAKGIKPLLTLCDPIEIEYVIQFALHFQNLVSDACEKSIDCLPEKTCARLVKTRTYLLAKIQTMVLDQMADFSRDKLAEKEGSNETL